MRVHTFSHAEGMQLEDILLKYIPIFNWFGESCVMTSDFHLTGFSLKKRRLTYFSSFCSLLILIIILFLYQPILAKNYVDGSHISQVLFYTSGVAMFGTKLTNICHIQLWLDLLPKLYKMIKDLQHTAVFKYKMDFRRFHMEFSQCVNTFIGLWLFNVVTVFIAHFKSPRDFAVVACDSIAFIFSFVLILHLRFYVLMFKSLIKSYIDYIERKVTNDMPKTLHQLRNEIHFIKINHFKLYEISKTLNAAFGWIFVVIFIEEFIEITVRMYWIFVRTECTNISKMMCPIGGFFSGIVTTIILINGCYHCSAWVQNNKPNYDYMLTS